MLGQMPDVEAFVAGDRRRLALGREVAALVAVEAERVGDTAPGLADASEGDVAGPVVVRELALGLELRVELIDGRQTVALHDDRLDGGELRRQLEHDECDQHLLVECELRKALVERGNCVDVVGADDGLVDDGADVVDRDREAGRVA